MHVGHRKGGPAGGLDKNAIGIGELQAGGDRLRIGHRDAFDRVVLRQIEDVLRHLTCTERAGDRRDRRQGNALACSETGMKRRSSLGLDGNDRHIRQAISLETGNDTRQQATTADARDDAIKLGALRDNLVDQGAVPIPQKRMIEWVHVGCLSGLRAFDCISIGFVEHRSVHQNRGAGCFDRLAHFRRRRLRYDDRHRNAERPSRISGGDPRIAAGGAENLTGAVLDLMLAKPANTAKLEASRGLQRVELQP